MIIEFSKHGTTLKLEMKKATKYEIQDLFFSIASRIFPEERFAVKQNSPKGTV